MTSLSDESNEFVDEQDGYVDVCVGPVQMQLLDGRFILEEDYRVSGEVWRVHKGDADPYPSNPHAHCIDGAKRFVGLTLHLGTAELFDGRKPVGRRLEANQFKRLIDLIRPKRCDSRLRKRFSRWSRRFRIRSRRSAGW